MSKYRLLGGVAATAIAMSGLAALPMSASATTSTQVVITPASGLINFQYPGLETRATGHNAFLENGLHVWTEGNTSTDKATGYITEDEPLADIGEPSLDWSLTDPNLPAIPGQQLVVDFDHDGAPDGILVGEPVYGNVWWLSNSSAQFVKDGAPHHGGGYGSDNWGTLNDWRGAFTTAQVKAYGYSLGSGVHGDGVISSMVFGDTTYTFALGLGPCEAAIDASSQTYTLTEDCSTLATIPVPDGWTVDGAGYTLTAVENASHPNFPGAILISATGGASPATLNVQNLHITTSFSGANSGGQLAGIKYNRAGGTINNVTINGVSHGNGVQEGIALYVRNRDAGGSYDVPAATVTINNVTVTNYQKSGIILDGNVAFTVTNSTVGSAAGPTGAPLTSLAANAVQISRAAHGTVSNSTIGLNEYNPDPPPGDGSYATAILVYDTKTVTLQNNIIAGTNGDVGLDAYDDSNILDTHVVASCNLFSRDETNDPYDEYGVAIAQWDDGSDPVAIDLSDTTFAGWAHNTSTISFVGDEPIFGPGAVNQSLNQCPPSAPGDVAVSGGDQETDVTWSASTDTGYAPLTGYTVTAKDSQGNEVDSEQVDSETTTAHLTGLASGQDYTVTVVATSGGGSSAPGTAILHATTLVLNSADASVPFGSKTMLTGTLSTTGGGVAGRQVVIQRQPAGAGNSWTDLATKTVNAAGTFTYLAGPSANVEYRAVYAGAPDNSSMSSVVSVDVRMHVKVRLSAKKGHVGKKFSFTGVVSPNHAGSSVELQVKQGAVWTTLDTHVLDAQSSYGFKWKATTPGVFKFRISADGDATHATGWSKSLTVTVQP